MSGKALSRLLKYGITTALGIGISVGYICYRGGFSTLAEMDGWMLYMTLCDAATIPGMLIFFMGCLVGLANTGVFDGLGYVLSTAVKMLVPGRALTMESYRDYVARKREGSTRGYGFMLIVGGGFLVVALLFLALYQGQL